jgi:protein-tyrosine-phosphatase
LARGAHGEDLPGAILFACTLNAVRSPMAAAMMRHLFGKFVYIESAGVRAGELDPFAVEAMEEIGIEIAKHKPRRFDDLEDGAFDLVVTLSPEAQHRAMELTRTSAAEIEYWPTMDPTAMEGSREQRLQAYREVRDELMRRIRARFSERQASDT